MSAREFPLPCPPSEALPFVRELLLEITRRIPSSLGNPPRVEARNLLDPLECAEMVRALLQWFDAIAGALEQRMEEFEGVFASLQNVVLEIQSNMRRAVHETRGWAEEEMTFAQSVREVLERLRKPVDANPECKRASGLLRQTLSRIESRIDQDRAEVLAVSTHFDSVQRNLEQLRSQIEVLEGRTRKLHNQSLRDGLTGLWNRRAYDQRLAEEISRALRHGGPLSIALWDVDHFKRVNDTHGHRTGDAVLQALSGRVLGILRRCDFMARYGGEEFAIILPHTDLEQALIAAERIRTAVAEEPVATGTGDLPITVSLGVACLAADDTADTFFERADRGLYQAKAEGRNRTALARASSGSEAADPA